MYIIIEGMPSSGKSTLAKKITDYYGMCDFKSLLATDSYGDIIRFFRDTSNNEELVDLFHLIDLMRNELQIIELLGEGNVVRDKCFISSLAHFECVKNNMSMELQKIILSTYDEIYRKMIKPDLVIFINRGLEECRRLSIVKSDKSAIDSIILDNDLRFKKQEAALYENVQKYFGDRLLVINDQYDMDNIFLKINEYLHKEL